VPFTYRIPEGSGLRTARGVSPGDLLSFVVGPDTLIADRSQRYGSQHETTGNTRGVAIAWAGGAWTHGTKSRVTLARRPEVFFANLRDWTAIDQGEVSASELDGWPALTPPPCRTARPG
jgi:hypothetical protein